MISSQISCGNTQEVVSKEGERAKLSALLEKCEKSKEERKIDQSFVEKIKNQSLASKFSKISQLHELTPI